MGYLWACMGMTLFGGDLYEGNPKINDLPFSGVYNYNDWLSAFISQWFCMIGTWVDDLVVACVGVNQPYSLGWFLSYAFFYSFYIVSPVMAFNTFTALAIDVYTKLQEAKSDDTPDDNDVEK